MIRPQYMLFSNKMQINYVFFAMLMRFFKNYSFGGVINCI